MSQLGTLPRTRGDKFAPQGQDNATALASNIAAHAAKAAVESIGFTEPGYQAAVSGQPLTENQAQQAQQEQAQQANQAQARQQSAPQAQQAQQEQAQQAQPAQAQQANQAQARQQSASQAQQAQPAQAQQTDQAQQVDSPRLSAFEQQQAQALSQQQHSPAVDVFEGPDEVLVLADLPGVDSDSIEVRANNSTISLSAERISTDEEGQRGTPIMSERGKVMQRQIQLPAECNVDDASASWDNGVVEITLPKIESESQKQIGVQ